MQGQDLKQLPLGYKPNKNPRTPDKNKKITKDLTVANSISVLPNVGIVIIESDYLLLKADPWSCLDGLLGLTVFVSPVLGDLM